MSTKCTMTLRKRPNRTFETGQEITHSIENSSIKTGAYLTIKKDRKTITPISLNTHFDKDVTSHVLSFKCLFCEAYIFTLQSFIIHLKSSHPNEDVSGMLNDHFRSCIVSVEKEKVVIVSYAFPRQDVDLYVSVDDATSSNSGPELSSQKQNSCQKVKNERSASPEVDRKSFASNETWENDSRSESSSNRVMNRADPEIRTGTKTVTNSVVDDAAVAQSPRSSQQASSDAKVNGSDEGAKGDVPIYLAENTRRRQMTSFEKIMALTCQKCGEKFKNRCMLTRHAIEHKRASNAYRCTVDRCLDSYAEKRKLISHLNYKHAGLSKEEREIMLAKGDELFEKLRNMSQNESLAYCSGAFPRSIPIISAAVSGLPKQMLPLTVVSSLTETKKTTSTPTTCAIKSSEEQLAPITAIDLMSTNSILKIMAENAEVTATRNEGNVAFQREVKSEIRDFDSADYDDSSATCTNTFTASVDRGSASEHSACNSLIVSERSSKMDVSSLEKSKRAQRKRSLTVRELLGLGATARQKIKCRKFARDASANEPLSASKQLVKSEFS